MYVMKHILVLENADLLKIIQEMWKEELNDLKLNSFWNILK